MTQIHRYAYIPNFNMKTKEYSWRKLKVVRVWTKPTTFGKGFEIIYILENSLRFNEVSLFTEEKIKTMSPKLFHNLTIERLMNNMGGFISQTIFPPNTEVSLRRSKEEML